MQHSELCGGYAFVTCVKVNRREQKGKNCDCYRFLIVIYVMSPYCTQVVENLLRFLLELVTRDVLFLLNGRM
jgi:hypothetical protein